MMPHVISFHALQSFAPSNLNRDDTGAPKDCVFGGVRRARVSSQCLKRSARCWWWEQKTLPGALATRSKRIEAELSRTLSADHGLPAVEADALAGQAMKALELKGDVKRPGETAVLVFFAPRELKALATAAVDVSGILESEPKKAGEQLRRAFSDAKAVDLALFGRMLAGLDGAGVEAACSVAHAISTHEVRLEEDYFTAVDDLKGQSVDEDEGAGMLGEVLFQSAVLYRYSSVDVDQLVANLSGDRALAKRAVRAYAAAICHALPSGKQKSFAAHNPPSLVMAALEPDALSLANAFLQPVRPHRGARLDALSAGLLLDEWRALTGMLGGDRGGVVCAHPAVLASGAEPASLERVSTLDELCARAGGMVDAPISASA